jgi:catechol 2,3-dioxygenase-like lactoylglutathione lyase family enzyme
MLDIESVNHVGIRVGNKERSVSFYESLGFRFETDAGFEQGHPIVMKHPSGVVLNLLGPATMPDSYNILMDAEDKYSGITHVALTVNSLESAKNKISDIGIPITGSFSFGGMSAIFIRDPDRNVIELDAYVAKSADDMSGYANHP